MLKLFLCIVLSLGCGGMTYADIAHEPCIDIDGAKTKVVVMPGIAQGKIRLENPTWMGENKECYLRVVHPALVKDGEWIPLEFSFIPGGDGEVTVWLRSNQVFGADKKTVPTWVEYRNLSINGCVPAINGFAQIDKSGKNGWHLATPGTLVNNGKKDTVCVWHDSVAFRKVKVIGGQEVTFKLEARFKEQ